MNMPTDVRPYYVTNTIHSAYLRQRIMEHDEHKQQSFAKSSTTWRLHLAISIGLELVLSRGNKGTTLEEIRDYITMPDRVGRRPLDERELNGVMNKLREHLRRLAREPRPKRRHGNTVDPKTTGPDGPTRTPVSRPS